MENKAIPEGFIFSLSFAQQRLWFLDQLEPDSPLYNIPQAFRMSGALSLVALRQTFEALVTRHEALRTTFSAVEGVPMQCIAEKGSISLLVIDLTGLPQADRKGEATRLAAEEFRRPFDLAQGPLLRVNLLRLGDKEHLLLLTMHHIISDGWSMGIMVHEMATLYEAFSQGTTPSLPELPIQYADFAEWQREWLQGEVLETQVSYWKEQLGGNLPLVALPADRPRPAMQTHRGKRKPLVLNKALSEELKALSQREKVTLFMTLLAAFQALLHLYTGQDDVIVGSPIANRNRLEIEGLIGFFVNTLVLRTDLSGNPTFRELLVRVREVALGAYVHQDLPFEKLVEELHVPRDLSYNPLFQVMFILQNAPLGPMQVSGLTLSPLEAERNTAIFDLTLALSEEAEGLTGSIEYNTDLFDAGTIDRMAGHLQTLLEGIVANPNARLSELPLLTEAERHQLLVEWNDTKCDYSKDKCIHELFEEQVERTPDAVALVFEDQRLTYRELNRRTNQLAHYLRKLGVGPEVLVGICMERSLEMVIGILGILKAGGAYVPLDPIYPKERLSFMLEDMRAPVILTQQRLASDLPPTPAKIIYLQAPAAKSEADDARADENPSSGATAANLAYVIYTSGSTGKPKGVLVPHANVVRLFAATEAWFHFGQGDVWTMFHSHAFDFSVWELWGALLYGGRLVVVPYEVSRSPGTFYELLVKEGVTVLNQTPSAFKQLMQAEESLSGEEDLPLRLIIFGGEALELQSLAPWIKRHGDKKPQLINMYGITETTVHVTYRPITADDVRLGRGSLIGIRIPDLQVYVLDQNLRPVPMGVRGELYVGGAGLARGYLNRPELTSGRFVPNPFSNSPGARLYKSGDVARYLPDQDLEYLGRADNQVQIRGFRVELGEIETVLVEHEAIREVVVIVREDVPGDKRLVAYIVPAGDHIPSVSVVSQYLRRKLPEYMVPNAFVMLEKLPLTPNGKIDRKALPTPTSLRPEVESAYVAPRNEVEETIAAMWQAVLRLEKIGIHDNFFEVGGYSLLATQVISRINKTFQINVSLRSFFENPTVAGLSMGIEETLLKQIEDLPEDDVQRIVESSE